jgi:hypothetical protein
VVSVSTNEISSFFASSPARRSTRILKTVPLSVSGLNRVGNKFMEATSAVSLNCHGCLYPSRHEYKRGSWVTLEIPGQRSAGKPRPVRAQVKFVRLPRNPHELYQVGVELEKPGNVWGVQSPPEDWLQYSVSIPIDEEPSATGVAAAPAPAEVKEEIKETPSVERANGKEELAEPAAPQTAAAEPASTEAVDPALRAAASSSAPKKPARVVIPADQLMRALEAKIEEAAQKGVASALKAHLGAALDQASKAVGSFTQASLHQIEEQCAQNREQLIAASSQEFRKRLEGDLAQADERLRKQMELFLNEAQETSQRLEKSVVDVRPVLAEAQEFMQEASAELQERFCGRLREIADRAGAEFDADAARFAHQQMGRLTEKAQSVASESATQLEARSAEARSHLETAAGTALAEFHVAAKGDIDQFILEARKSVESSLLALAKETRADWEARLQACRNELERTGAEEIAKFRRSLESIANTSVVTAISAVHDHSKALLEALARGSAAEPEENGNGNGSLSH